MSLPYKVKGASGPLHWPARPATIKSGFPLAKFCYYTTKFPNQNASFRLESNQTR
jgi:hypothetical protein